MRCVKSTLLGACFLILGQVSGAAKNVASKDCELPLRPGKVLGHFTMNAKSRRTESIEFEIEPNTASFVLSADSLDPEIPHDLMIAEIRDPSGKMFTEQSFKKTGSKALFGNRAYFPGSASQLLPNNATSPKLKAGKWTMIVESSEAIKASIEVRIKSKALDRDRDPFSPQKLKIYLYLSGSNGLSLGNYKSSSFKKDVLPKLNEVFESSGIQIEVTEVQSIPETFQNLATYDRKGSTHVNELYATLPIRDDGFNLVIIDQLHSEISHADGISTGAPASLKNPHVLASNHPISNGERRLPTHALIAHEIGHALGLFHVCEFDGQVDPLPGTEVGQNDLMDINYAGDLMNVRWAFNLDQTTVIRLHPFVEKIRRP